jgi:hypothetical protein
MRKLLAVPLVVVVSLLSTGASAQGPGTPGPGTQGPGQMGPGMMGPGMMYPCGGMRTQGATPAPQMTADAAKQVAQQYADSYLKGFTVDKVLPFTGMGMTMYSVELKSPQGENRTLHVNPWGGVMPFGGPWRRSS